MLELISGLVSGRFPGLLRPLGVPTRKPPVFRADQPAAPPPRNASVSRILRRAARSRVGLTDLAL